MKIKKGNRIPHYEDVSKQELASAYMKVCAVGIVFKKAVDAAKSWYIPERCAQDYISSKSDLEVDLALIFDQLNSSLDDLRNLAIDIKDDLQSS
jgi:ABC-type proline/glycine betaine transport system substrate-binding protein